MGKALISTKLKPEEIEKLKQLHFKANPAGDIPAFGELNQETMILRDENDPSRIVGYIHYEKAILMREMVMDPDYEFKAQGLSHAYVAFETRLRCGDLGNADRYYASVPEAHKHVQRFYDGEGSVRVDNNTIRYLKKV